MLDELHVRHLMEGNVEQTVTAPATAISDNPLGTPTPTEPPGPAPELPVAEPTPALTPWVDAHSDDHEARIRNRGPGPLQRVAHVGVHRPGNHDAVRVPAQLFRIEGIPQEIEKPRDAAHEGSVSRNRRRAPV